MKTFILKRKQIIIFILTLTLCAAIVINWYYTGRGNVPSTPEKEIQQNLGEAKQVSTDESAVSASAAQTYFTNAKLKRDAECDESKDMLKDIIESKDSGEASVKDAQEKLNKIIDNSKLQVDAENIITAKLNCESLVIINSDSSEILIPEKSLNDNAAIQIKEVILSKTGLPAEKISIIGVKNVVEN